MLISGEVYIVEDRHFINLWVTRLLFRGAGQVSELFSSGFSDVTPCAWTSLHVDPPFKQVQWGRPLSYGRPCDDLYQALLQNKKILDCVTAPFPIYLKFRMYDQKVGA